MTKSGLAQDLILFAVAAALTLAWQKRASAKAEAASSSSCPAAPLVNSAFVFVKPHANTAATQKLVKSKLIEAGIAILSESDIDGETIDEKKLIDQHYYAIASKATILSPKDIPVPADKFKDFFGEDWSVVLKEGRAYNAMEACQYFGCTANELNDAWQKAKLVKFGGGFYCGLVSASSTKPPAYVFNAFFMTMRSKFVTPGTSIHCYEVEWNQDTLSWSAFRNELLGPTDPAEGPVGSIRRTILDDYKSLGLSSQPNKGDNGVHASASPLEGLAEKTNWLGIAVKKDGFGKALLDAGVSLKTIQEWSVDPQVALPDGSKGSIFDAVEDMDADGCLETLVKINKLNA